MSFLPAAVAGVVTSCQLFSREREISEELGMNTVMINIEGMHCDGCAHRIKILLEREPGVRDAQVSLSSGLAEVKLRCNRWD